jgi:hypothetical protein
MRNELLRSRHSGVRMIVALGIITDFAESVL